MDKENIVKREIRFSLHIPKNDLREDLHYIKEQITLKDGSIVPNTYLVKDFKRKIWVTKKSFRNHNDKKEFESIDKLLEVETTQSDLDKTIVNLLNVPHKVNDKDFIKDSPYVYGYDITSTSFIKLKSLMKNNFIQSSYTVASFDIETNPYTDEILLASIAFKDKVHTSILAKFVHNIPDIGYRLKQAIKKYLPQYENLVLTYKVCQNEVELISDIFNIANKWSPDFLAIWNMDFDIPKILSRLDFYKVNPIDVICDKTIPRHYRICKYRQGIKKKITASGVVKPINPSLQWHSLISTTSFYVIDAMCVYRQLRMAKQEEPSYSLDAILKKEINSQKLKFDEANEYKGIKWHLFLQERYPVEYIVYNIYDCLGMLELDAKIKDLSNTLPSFAGISDFTKFNSNPKKIVDALFIFGLEKGKIIGTVPKLSKDKENEVEVTDMDDEEEEELSRKDYKTLGLKGWIQLLPQNLLQHEGLQCLEEYPKIITNARGMVVDLDSVSSYPSCTLVANVSKQTCVNEVIKIEGIKEDIFKEQNLSICLGESNLLEYCNIMFDLPSLEEVDKII